LRIGIQFSDNSQFIALGNRNVALVSLECSLANTNGLIAANGVGGWACALLGFDGSGTVGSRETIVAFTEWNNVSRSGLNTVRVGPWALSFNTSNSVAIGSSEGRIFRADTGCLSIGILNTYLIVGAENSGTNINRVNWRARTIIGGGNESRNTETLSFIAFLIFLADNSSAFVVNSSTLVSSESSLANTNRSNRGTIGGAFIIFIRAVSVGRANRRFAVSSNIGKSADALRMIFNHSADKVGWAMESNITGGSCLSLA
jgi:hypothetical protein